MENTMQLYCHANRGRSVASRWGHIVFDSAGYAEHEIPAVDAHLMIRLGWAVPEKPSPVTTPAPKPAPVPAPGPAPVPMTVAAPVAALAPVEAVTAPVAVVAVVAVPAAAPYQHQKGYQKGKRQ